MSINGANVPLKKLIPSLTQLWKISCWCIIILRRHLQAHTFVKKAMAHYHWRIRVFYSFFLNMYTHSKMPDNLDIERFEDATTCCICTDVFTDPVVLPCIHSLRMKCLQEIGLRTDKGPGDEIPCPICRRMFRISAEGFLGLHRNFFIQWLIQVSNL